MPLVVQKYGGTSVATPKRIQSVARRLVNTQREGCQVVAVISAMAVNALGGRAISLTGAQAGILTDRNHAKARIANISPKQIHELLSDDYIVIVAGFQGQTPEGETA